MFRRSRKKIILSIMGPLILLFVLTLSVIMLASYREIRQRNAEMLERYAELYSLEHHPGDQGSQKPDPGVRPGKPPIDDRPD